MLELAGWVAPAATMIAAIMTAANLGARVTGWGFAVFTIGAAAWIVVGFETGQQNLLLSNAFLLLIDLIGMWRWLGRRARYDAGAKVASVKSARIPGPTLFALTKIEGMPVRDANGTVVATVVDAMATCDRGGIAYLVVREGGVAGVGERLHALGWNEIVVRDGAMECEFDAENLARRAVLAPGQWPATAAAAGVA